VSVPLLRLDECCKLVTDGTHHSPPNAAVGAFKYVTAKNIKEDAVVLKDITYVSAAVHREVYARCPVEEGDVLYIKDGVTTGVAAVNHLSEPFSLLSSVALLKPDASKIDSRYLMHWLNSPSTRETLLGQMSGSAIRRIILRTLRSAEVPVPPLEEQQRTVARLDALRARSQRAKDALDAVPALLDRLRQSILGAAFRGDLTADWREQNPDVEPASELLKRIRIERRKRWEQAELAKMVAKGKPPKDDRWKLKCVEPAPADETDVTELPDGWCWASLREIAELKGGITKGQKRPDATKLREVPYLRVANVQRGHLKLDEITTIAATAEEIADLALERGDMLFNEGGDRDKLGRGWIWEDQIPECIHQNHVFRGRLVSDAIEPALVSHYTNSMGQAYFLREGSQTTNLASINITKLGALPVPLLPPTEQRVLLDRLTIALSAVTRLAGEARSALAVMGELERAVLAAAFRGAFANDTGVAQ
jgi:type I restriction enzyme S subunit